MTSPLRRLGLALGLAGCLLSGAASARADVNPPGLGAGQHNGWSIVLSPNGAPPGLDDVLVEASAPSVTDAWAVGYDGFVGGLHTLAERWNGSSWTRVHSPNPSSMDNVLFAVSARSPVDAWAVGYDVVPKGTRGYHKALAEHWNGTAWRVVPAAQPGHSDNDLEGVVALSATNVWAVGNEDVALFTFRPLVEHWNGSSWTVIQVPSPPLTGVGASLSGVSAASPRDIWAVGSYQTSASGFQPLIEHWDGTHWTIVTTPTVPGVAQLNKVSFATRDDGWAVGYTQIGTNTQPLLEHWDGHRWYLVESPTIKQSILAGVLTLGPNSAWAVGNYRVPGGIRTLIEQWDGHALHVVPSPGRNPSSELLGIAGTTQHLWAVGDSLTRTLILHR